MQQFQALLSWAEWVKQCGHLNFKTTQMFFKMVVLKNYEMFTEKQLANIHRNTGLQKDSNTVVFQ